VYQKQSESGKSPGYHQGDGGYHQSNKGNSNQDDPNDSKLYPTLSKELQEMKPKVRGVV